MGGGSHRPPRLDKKHLTPRSPRLSGPVPTCRSCGFMRAGINPAEETSEFHSSGEKSNRQPDATMSPLRISPSFLQVESTSLSSTRIWSTISISHRLTLNSAHIHPALVVLHPEKSLSDTKMAPIPQPGSLEIFDYLWVHVVYTFIMFNFF